jgi:type I restriction enzyme R subunit
VTNILPNGYKAQVVAYSRLAAIRYFEALKTARDELLAEAEALEPRRQSAGRRGPVPAAAQGAGGGAGLALPRHLARIEFAPIISGSNNDDPGLEDLDRRRGARALIKRFKKPLFHATAREDRPAGFPRGEVDAAHRLRCAH